jgi:hypothetical protein
MSIRVGCGVDYCKFSVFERSGQLWLEEKAGFLVLVFALVYFLVLVLNIPVLAGVFGSG